MAASTQAITSTLGATVAVCVSLVVVANYRKKRVLPGELCDAKSRQRGQAPAAAAAAAVAHRDRRAAENEQEQVFSLYEKTTVDAEPRDPPMELSKSVLALLESFDVDPVRGESRVSWVMQRYTSTAFMLKSLRTSPHGLCRTA